MNKTKNYSKFRGWIILYILSRIGVILLGILMAGVASASLIRPHTPFLGRMFAAFAVFATALNIIVLIYLLMRKPFFRTVHYISFGVTALACASLASLVIQDGKSMIPLVPIAALLLAELLWALYSARSLRAKAITGFANKDGSPKPAVTASASSSRPSGLNTRYYNNIAAIISRYDQALDSAVSSITADPAKFFQRSRADFSLRGIEKYDSSDAYQIMWLGLIDQLEKRGYVRGIDWKAPVPEIISSLKELTKTLGLPVAWDLLSLEDNIAADMALKHAADHLLQYGLILGELDTGSDEHELFIVEASAAGRLQELARLIRRKINFTFGYPGAPRDYAEEALRLKPFPGIALQLALRSWLMDMGRIESIPRDITAVNFGLFEPYGVELTGATAYDAENNDWACEEAFVPQARSCPGIKIDAGFPWQRVLYEAAFALRSLKEELPGNAILSIPHITTGFQDGGLWDIGACFPFITRREYREKPPQLYYAIHDFSSGTSIPSLKLTAAPGAGDAYASKLGGRPYLPPGFAYPANRTEGFEDTPLRLLAQLNFSRLPKLPGYPGDGILQFYVSCDDSNDLMGMDFSGYTSQKAFRVIYHGNVEKDERRLMEPPAMKQAGENDFFPFSGEYLLTAEPENQPMSCSDYRFDETFIGYYRAYFPETADIPGKHSEAISGALLTSGHRMGGYPFFTQTDPREDARYSDYTKLLLQIDSDQTAGIMWGDCGVANFFITPQQLENRDFSKVLYTWDCY